MDRRWICGDVWMDILPSFNRPQLGLKMALLSDRFDVLVDTHFDGKTELTIWRETRIREDKGPKAKLSVLIDCKFVEFPLPDRPLPTKIRFNSLWISYIDHSVLTFLRSNKPIWDRSGIKLDLFVPLYMTDVKLIWDVFTHEIWPIFATNIHRLDFLDGDDLDKLRRHISPTILTDLDQLYSIDSGALFPDGIADDGPNATAGQALTKWLHTPSKNGQPKRLLHYNYFGPPNLEWVNDFKETFRRATTSVSYHIQFYLRVEPMPIEPFELVNEVTNEKLTLTKDGGEFNWLLERCPIIGETAAVQKQQQKKDENSDANLNKVFFRLYDDIGPLSPPGQSNEKVFSFSGSSDQRKKKK